MNAEPAAVKSEPSRSIRANSKLFSRNPAADFLVPEAKSRPIHPKKPHPDKEVATNTGEDLAGTWRRGEAAEKKSKEVIFIFDLVGAQEVFLVGDFTEWQSRPIPMAKSPGGTWHAKVKLSTGSHRYRYLVDGRWYDDPFHPYRVPNPFGSYDNLIEIT